jgi:hypothetical protein
VAEWQTRQSQKLLRGNSRAGSSPAFGTSLISSQSGIFLCPKLPYQISDDKIKKQIIETGMKNYRMERTDW